MKKLLIIGLIALMLLPLQVLAITNDLKTTESDNSLISNAVSGILIEANSGEIVFEKEIHKEVAIASMTKMVAQIIILEKIKDGSIHWDDIITVSKNAAEMGGSQIYISEGEKITVKDLMKGISMASANDATVQMAEVIAGDEAKFVELMNQKVKELGLKNTAFKNSTGLDEEGHYSSAYDMAMIARDLVVNHPEILEFSSIYEDYLRQDTENKFWLVNTNKLVRFYEGADGLKTGHTDAAKYCLAATAKKNDLRFIAIVLGEENSKIRNQEVMTLLDYGFNQYQMSILKKKDEIIKEIKVDKATTSSISFVPRENIGILLKKGEKSKQYTYDVKLEPLKFPMKPGDIVGKVYIKDGKKTVQTTNVTVAEAVDELSFLQLLSKGLVDIASGNIGFST